MIIGMQHQRQCVSQRGRTSVREASWVAPAPVAVAVRVTQRLHPGVPVAAVRAQAALLTLLGPDGVAALPCGIAVTAPPAPAAPAWSPCGGLDGAALVAAAFLEPQGHGAFAVTSDGRLVVLYMGGNGGKKGCQVRQKM